MNTAELQIPPPSPSAAFDRPASERAIFVDEGERRARWLGRLGRGAAVLFALWLVALLAGALGFGRLPGVPYLVPAAHPARSAAGPRSARPPAPAAPTRDAVRQVPRAASAARVTRAGGGLRRSAARRGPRGSSARTPTSAGGSLAAPGRTARRPSAVASPPSLAPGRSATSPGAARGGGQAHLAPGRGTVGAPGRSSTAPGHTKAAPGGGSSRSTPHGSGHGSRSSRP